MSNNKIYWKGNEELEQTPAFVAGAEKEFSEQLPIDKFLSNNKLDSTNTSRRDFLKFMGFGITAATLAACETPVIKSLPYVVKPNEVMPGIANYYASTYFDGLDYASILVKTREGRPIHIESNKQNDKAVGGVSARVNSSVLSLYNKRRFAGPMKDGQASDWATVDADIKGKIDAVKSSGGTIKVLTSTIISPTSMKVIDGLKSYIGSSAVEGEEATAAGGVDHVMYDAVSVSAIRNAHAATHGANALPSYDFSKAKALVSIDADFLGSWVNPGGFDADYASRRNPEGDMSKHYHFEANLSLTGSNADVRGAVMPSEAGVVAKMLYNAVASQMGGSGVGNAALANDDNNVASKIKAAAKDLVAAKGAALVVCGSNDVNVQSVVNGLNEMLGAYGSTIDIDNGLNTRKGNDADMLTLVSDMKSGGVDMLMVIDCDPVYTTPAAMGFEAAMAKVKTVVSFGQKPDHTTAKANYICPTNHYLESWNDANPVGDQVTFTQPTINAIYNTRQWQDSMLTWTGGGSYYDMLQKQYDTGVTAADDPSVIFASRWNTLIHDGHGTLMAAAPAAESSEETEATEMPAASFNADAVSGAASQIKGGGSGTEVSFYVKAAIGNGENGDNPWLQELPDPITKVVWDQYVTMNPAEMKEMGLNTMMGEQERSGMVRVTVGGISYELPVVAVPGQKKGSIGLALGYGKASVIEDETERIIGENAFKMMPVVDGNVQNWASATIEKIERRYNIASTQTHHTMMGRKILNETNMEDFKANGRESWNPLVTLGDAYGNETPVSKLDLWAEQDIDLGHRWGLSVDLNACTGCGACVTACHSENNVPVVGKDEINRNRSMSWLRIDRYYSSDADPEVHGDINQDKDYAAMEVPSDYPEVGFMPVMCQHCNHAPCETVCPVAATTHSDEGYNQMTYNRCIGTRYCANNCPYKVRRFNWFNYVGDSKFTDVNPAQDDLARMVLNPDVVVRSRGVMEKCSLCVQRVQGGKLDAKKKGQPIKDGDIQTACSAACASGAIKFGDINDSSSVVRTEAMNDRAYNLLEEVGVKPNVWYQTKVRNVENPAEQSA